MFTFRPGWLTWWVLLTLRTSASGLEIFGYDSDEVICSQVLSECAMEDVMPLLPQDDAVDVQNLTADFKLCTKSDDLCALCLVIETELLIHPDGIMEDEGHSGLDEEDDSVETSDPKASVTVCHQVSSGIPTCKKVEFTVNHTAVTQKNQAQMSMVITGQFAVSFGSKALVYLPKFQHPPLEVHVPSLNEVCFLELGKCVEECRVPKLDFEIREEMSHVELQLDGRNDSLPSVCVQYERNGTCQIWNRKTIPLSSVAHCMCFMAWYDQRDVRSQRCPFTDLSFSQGNVWQNISVSVGQGQMNKGSTMLWWNLSAPCRLEGEVWPCHRVYGCREMTGFRQQLGSGMWEQNSTGLWELIGVFEDIDLQLSPCVKVKVKGMKSELGPFCLNNTDRWRWSLLAVAGMLLVCLAALVFCLLHGFVKKWVWSWRHGGFVKIGRKGRVVLLSPPDADDGVSESVCGLGSLLCNQGFKASVDQWSRKEQCTLGPLPWLHSQLLELNSRGDRVVVVLSRKALERAEAWARQHKEVIRTEGEDTGLPQMCSPYSDVFTASLCLIQADKQQGRAGERFILVKFDSHPSSHKNLPELLRGLPLFQLPSQTQALLTELSVGGAGRRSGGKTWTGWKWGGLDGWRSKTKEGAAQQKASLCKYIGVEKSSETKPLKGP